MGAEAPHAVGEDDDDGEEDYQGKGGRVVGEDEGKGVHGGMEDDHGEKVGAGTVVEPGEDDGHRNEEDDAEEEIVDQGEAKGAMKIKRGVPEGPRKPDEEAGEERRKALLEMRKKESAPAGFFQGGGEEEIVQEENATVSGGEPNGGAMLRPLQRLVREMCDGGGNEQNYGPKEKGGSLPAPIAGMNEGVEEFADTGVAREGAGENPGGDGGEESDGGVIENGSWGVDAAEFVVGDVDGPGEEPEQCEREKTRGKALAGDVLSAAGEENGGECGAGRAEGGDVLAVVRADAEELCGDPDEPGDSEGEEEVEPDWTLHIAGEISLKRVDGKWIRGERAAAS